MLQGACFYIVPEWNMQDVNSTPSYLKVHALPKGLEQS
jgi:hypothetical protein